jgi:hypothetical protein
LKIWWATNQYNNRHDALGLKQIIETKWNEMKRNETK